MTTITAITELNSAFERLSKLNPDAAKKVLHEIPSSERDVYHAAINTFKKENQNDTTVSDIHNSLVIQLNGLLQQVETSGTITTPRDQNINVIYALFLKVWRGFKNCVGLRMSSDEFLADIHSHLTEVKRYDAKSKTFDRFHKEHFEKDRAVSLNIINSLLTHQYALEANRTDPFQDLFGKLQEKKQCFFEDQGVLGDLDAFTELEKAYRYHRAHVILMGDNAMAPTTMAAFYAKYLELIGQSCPESERTLLNNAIHHLVDLFFHEVKPKTL